MEEIEIGEYVRDCDGNIVKVRKIEKDNEFDDVWYGEERFKGTWKSLVTKHSKNIIDILEVGDIIEYKKWDVIRKWEIVDVGRECVFTLKDVVYANEIKAILNHEIYENMCYRMEE